MSDLQDQRAQLTRKLAEISALRALYMERHGPILADRTRRRELESKLRVHDKAILAVAEAQTKLALVCEGLRQPPQELAEITSDEQARARGANAFHRRSLLDEESHLCRYLAELKPEADLVRDLKEQLAKLLPEDPLLAEMVEDVQHNYNIVQEDLRRIEVALAAEKEATP